MAITLDGTTGITTPSDTISGNLTFTGTGNRITGDFSNATVANRVMFQTSTTNGNTVLNLIPNGTGTTCAFNMDSDPALTNSSTCSLNLIASTEVRLNSGIRGTGTYLPMTFYTGGSERMRIDSSGNVGIATTTTTRAKLNIDTDGTNTSAGYGLALTNTAGGGATWTLQCGDQGVNNGAFTIRQTGISGTTWFKIEATTGYITVQGVYNLTTASAANVFVGTGGDLRRSTSSLKYKTDVQDATYGLAEVMVLRPVTYKGKNDGDTIFGGLIAEEVDAAGLTEFVQYADDGTPDALAYGNMVSLCIKAIQEQQALIISMREELDALKLKVGA